MLGIAANLCASESRRQLREREIVHGWAVTHLDEDNFTRLEHELDAASAYRALRDSNPRPSPCKGDALAS